LAVLGQIANSQRNPGLTSAAGRNRALFESFQRALHPLRFSGRTNQLNTGNGATNKQAAGDRPIAISFAYLWLLVLVVLLIGFFSYRTWSASGRQSAQIAVSQRITESTSDLLASLTDAEAGQRGFLLTGRDIYLEPYKEALQAIPGALDSLQTATTTRPDQAARLERLKPLIRAKLDELQATIELRNREGAQAGVALVLTDQGVVLMGKIRQICHEMQSVAYERLSQESAQAFSTANQAGLVSTAGSVALAALLILSVVRLRVATKRREELNRNLFEMAAIVESSDDAIISKDLNGIVTSWNPGAERIFGYTKEEMIGRPISILASPDRVDEMPRILDRIARGVRLEHFETRRRTKDGRDIDISLTVSPIRDEKGKIIGASKISRDITERVMAEKERRRQAEVIARSNADLEHFAYAASHDLREPLRTISVYSQILERHLGPDMDEESAASLRAVHGAAGRMGLMLDGLLEYTRAGELGHSVSVEVDTEAALKSALANLQGAIEDNHAVITHDPLPRVRGNELHFVQIFQNVISNALKYRGKDAPVIHLSAQRKNRELLFSIRDNGQGIPPEYHARIFEMFKRLHGQDIPGSGIGLAACKKIIDQYGGRIWVESQPGEGATFFFTVPSK
jgi:hypothetical protein